MFAHTGYDAYFSYMALSIHSKLVQFLTSNEFFKGLLLFIFAMGFFIITIQYFSRHLPGTVFDKKYVSFSKYIKLIVCFVLGVALLKVDSAVDVKKYDRSSWSGNKFVVEKVGDFETDLRVSLPIDIAIRVVEEISWGATKMVDWVFGSLHSQTDSPNFFYKSLFYAASAQITDPALREMLEVYSKECIWKALPLVHSLEKGDLWGKLHSHGELPGKIEKVFREIIVSEKDGQTKTCNDLRYEVNRSLYNQFPQDKMVLTRLMEKIGLTEKIGVDSMRNLKISNALLEFYRDQKESEPGVMKGAKVPGTYGSFWQYLGKLGSIEGLKRASNNHGLAGASLATDKAKEFNELLRRAPFIQGLIKLLLIGFIAPFLVFFIVARNLKILIWWFLAFASVVFWTPVWHGLYSIMTNFAYAGRMAENFGRLSDGFSLYAANSVMSDAYYFYSIIFWAMMASSIAMTGGVIYLARGMMSDTREDHIPDAVPQIANTAIAAGTLGRIMK